MKTGIQLEKTSSTNRDVDIEAISVHLKNVSITNVYKTSQHSYEKAFNEDPFSEKTIVLADSVTTRVAESRQKSWIDFVESIDMKQSSQNTWKKLKLCGDRISDNTPSSVTANQVATQLIANSRSHGPTPTAK